MISIHALRVEGDNSRRAVRISCHISIHALRVEGDYNGIAFISFYLVISIHALRVEGDQDPSSILRIPNISIHALRVEGDILKALLYSHSKTNFYPRPPGGGRQGIYRQSSAHLHISIHALRVEGDITASIFCQ